MGSKMKLKKHHQLFEEGKTFLSRHQATLEDFSFFFFPKFRGLIGIPVLAYFKIPLRDPQFEKRGTRHTFSIEIYCQELH